MCIRTKSTELRVNNFLWQISESNFLSSFVFHQSKDSIVFLKNSNSRKKHHTRDTRVLLLLRIRYTSYYTTATMHSSTTVAPPPDWNLLPTGSPSQQRYLTAVASSSHQNRHSTLAAAAPSVRHGDHMRQPLNQSHTPQCKSPRQNLQPSLLSSAKVQGRPWTSLFFPTMESARCSKRPSLSTFLSLSPHPTPPSHPPTHPSLNSEKLCCWGKLMVRTRQQKLHHHNLSFIVHFFNLFYVLWLLFNFKQPSISLEVRKVQLAWEWHPSKSSKNTWRC